MHRANSCQVDWDTSESLPYFQHWKWYVYSRHDWCWLLWSSAILVKTQWLLTTSHSKYQTSKVTTHLYPQHPLTFAQSGISDYLCLISRNQHILNSEHIGHRCPTTIKLVHNYTCWWQFSWFDVQFHHNLGFPIPEIQPTICHAECGCCMSFLHEKKSQVFITLLLYMPVILFVISHILNHN